MKILPGRFIHILENIFKKTLLQLPSPLDDRLCLLCTNQRSLASVPGKIPSVQIPVPHQALHIDRHQIGFQPPQLHDVLSRIVVRIIGQEHQYIESCLGHSQFPTDGFTANAVGLIKIMSKFNVDSF